MNTLRAVLDAVKEGLVSPEAARAMLHGLPPVR